MFFLHSHTRINLLYGSGFQLCHKTKTKVITLTNHKKNTNNTMDQSELEANTCNWCQARQNACERGTIGFGFASHWLRKWREFC